MNLRPLPLAWLLLAPALAFATASAIRPLPENPRYLEWRDKPLVLVTSGEHYGSVVNPDFNYTKYLDTIAAAGFNHTRLFLGEYLEEQGDFGMVNNPLQAPGDRVLVPWARSNVPGYSLGGNKFDLDRWNPAYFERLHAFLDAAESRGITVEAVLFFAGSILKNHPLSADNNVNNLTRVTAKQYLTLSNGNVLARQEAYCRKLVQELNRHGNVIINVCNEPWFDHQERPGFASQTAVEVKQWIEAVSCWILDEESRLPVRHMLSVDLTNQGYPISTAELSTYYRHIAMFNVHYDANGDILAHNRGVARAFALNETGFNGTSDRPYRLQGWRFLFEGGAMYGNLDFSFAVGHEIGDLEPKFMHETYDCGGGPALRKQLSILNRFINSLPLARLQVDNSIVVGADGSFNALAAPGEAYAVWFPGEGEFDTKINIPAGAWKFEWVNIMTGEVTSLTRTPARWVINLHGKREGGGVALRITKADQAAAGQLGDQADSQQGGETKK